MSKQAALDGFAPPRSSDRLFLALRPDGAATARIAALARRLREEHGMPGRPLDDARLHVTLQFFGGFAGLPQGLVTAIERVVDGIEVRAFELAFDHVASFDGGGRRRPWVLRGSEDGLAGLHALYAALGQGFVAAGVRVEGHARYVPHLTLLYGDRALPRQAVDPITWTVRELVLVDSLVGQGVHRALQRWPLWADRP